VNVTGEPGVPDYIIDPFAPRRHDLALVIPVINENGRITAQLQLVRDLAPDVDVVIADGGSEDGSTAPGALAALGVRALLTKTGPGRLSAQLRMGFHYALKEGYAGIITMDGNGKDDPKGIAEIARALRRGEDFVQGSRFVKGGRAQNTPWERYAAIRLIHAPITSIGARRKFTDTTNGFRGHSRRLLTDPRVDPFRDVFNTYELLAYLPIRASRLGYRVGEVPVTRAYRGGVAKPTKIKGAAAHADLLKIVARACFGGYAP
jgi:glycosyltransferase involved in cell wall biosynthesis